MNKSVEDRISEQIEELMKINEVLAILSENEKMMEGQTSDDYEIEEGVVNEKK